MLTKARFSLGKSVRDMLDIMIDRSKSFKRMFVPGYFNLNKKKLVFVNYMLTRGMFVQNYFNWDNLGFIVKRKAVQMLVL